MLLVRKLSKSFGATIACRDVSFALRRGEILCVEGPNGSGKSTLINLLSGFLRADRGSIILDGKSVEGLPAYARRGLGMTRSFQWPRIYPEWTVRAAMLATSRIVRSKGAGGELFRTLGLCHVQNQRASRLSLKDQKLLDLAMSLVGCPTLALLDEPCAALPEQSRDLVSRVIADDVAGQGVAVIVVDHNHDFLQQLHERTGARKATMDEGELSISGGRHKGIGL